MEGDLSSSLLRSMLSMRDTGGPCPWVLVSSRNVCWGPVVGGPGLQRKLPAL